MKKIVFMTAAMVAMIASSCVKEQGTGGADTKEARLSVKIGNTSSRAIELPGQTAENTIVLNDGWIYVLTPTNAVKYEEKLIVGTGTNSAQVGDGQVLGKNVPSDSRVFIVGNYAAAGLNDDAMKALTTLDAITKTVAAMSTQSNYKAAVLTNFDGKPVQITVKNPVTFDDPEDTATVEANVSVSINPVISRLELGKVTGGPLVASFTVAGVYVDDWYSQFTFGASYSGDKYTQGQELVFPATAMAAKFPTALGDNTGWASSVATPKTATTEFVAAVASPDDPATVDDPATTEVVEPSVELWAYNVAAGALPRFIIVLENVVYYVDADKDGNADDANADGTPDTNPQDGKLYLTVTGYNQEGTSTAITAFNRGSIYNIGGKNDGTGKGIVFDPDDTGLTPNPEDVTLQVKVLIKEWTIVYPDPVL